MGVIKQGILGGFSGKVGSVVGSSWKGLAVIKAKPLSVANPNTAGQQAQRGAFGQCVAFAKRMLADVIKPLNDRFAVAQSGFNKFIKLSIGAFDTDGLATAASLKLSQGSLNTTPTVGGSAGEGTEIITVSWNDNSGSGNALATDLAYVVAYNETTDELFVSAGVETRDSATLDFTGTGVSENDVIRAYVSFIAADNSKVSDSRYGTFNAGA